MTDKQTDKQTDEQHHTNEETDLQHRPHVFGLRAAALAGIVVSASAVAIGFTGTFDHATDLARTTCCPPAESIME